MAKESTKKERSKWDLVIEGVLIIIIIILLLHNCCLMKKGPKNPGGNVNVIDITCDNKECQYPEEVSVDCLNDLSNEKCIVPNFVGKKKEDILRWLSAISNTINIEFKTTKSDASDGTVLEQSISGISIKDLIEGKQKLEITLSNNGSLVDCSLDEENNRCVIPDFAGKTMQDVEDWLKLISNNVLVKYNYRTSGNTYGTILEQSIPSGERLKRIIENGETLVITIATRDNSAPVIKPDYNNGYNNTQPSIPDEDETDDGFFVSDASVKWSKETELSLFTNSMYDLEGKIAPESTNTYQFVVNNDTKYNIRYKMSFVEDNPYHINMKFKLKKNDTYIIDQYVSYNELNLNEVILNSKDKDTYYLEWKWESSSNDTEIGKLAKNQNVEYQIKINVVAESV